MKNRYTVQPARNVDLKGAKRMLQENDLVTEGLDEQWEESYCLARHKGKIIGVCGIEIYGSFGLLRSVAVSSAWQGKGIGGAMIRNRLAWAGSRGLSRVYLLTIDAEGYFDRLGFKPVNRRSIPSEIKKSAEFSSICPASAVAMAYSLSKAKPDIGIKSEHDTERKKNAKQ